MIRLVIRLVMMVAVGCLLAGCISPAQHEADVNGGLSAAEEARLTLAAVQRNVKLGMSGSDVLESLGSPNMVSTDADRNEVWVYDRVGTQYSYSESGAGLFALVGAASGGVAGGVAPSVSSSAGSKRRAQRTLTIIIHFDESQRVDDFSYHASQF